MIDRAKLKRIAKVVIAIVVAVGLVLATRKAIDQWNAQRTLALDRVALIDESLRLATDARTQKTLTAERDARRAAVPNLVNLDWSRIGLASLFYAIGLIPGGIVLAEATRAVGHPVSLHDAMTAQIVGHLGKYVPGKAMVVVMRAGRLSRRGVPIVFGSAAVVMETLLMMAVGAALAGVLVWLLPVPRLMAVTAITAGVLASIPTIPPIFRRVLVRLRPRSDSSPLEHRWRFFFQAWIWQLVAWAFIGASFACLLSSLPGNGPERSSWVVLASSVAAIALAMVLGFASLLPGGAGVRELTLAIVLAPIVGESQALLGAIAARLLFIVVELVAAGIVIWIDRTVDPEVA